MSHEPKQRNQSQHSHIELYNRRKKGFENRTKVTFTVQGERAVMPSSDPSFPKGYAILYGGPNGLNCECLSYINGNAAQLNNIKAELDEERAKILASTPFKCYHIFAAEFRHKEIFK